MPAVMVVRSNAGSCRFSRDYVCIEKIENKVYPSLDWCNVCALFRLTEAITARSEKTIFRSQAGDIARIYKRVESLEEVLGGYFWP